MLDGVVDMQSFNQILALDENDPNREFSKTLIWAWCDQAEMAVEEMEIYLARDNIVDAANKAHYLKGSSASLGLLRVSHTCQSIYHLHFPPGLGYMRSYSHSSSAYTSSGSSSNASSSFSSGTSSSTSTSGPPSPELEISSPLKSATLGQGTVDFEKIKVDRAKVLLVDLKKQITQASDWLYRYYKGSDRYAASQ